MRKFLVTTSLALALGVAALASAHAQSGGGAGGASDNSAGGGAGGAGGGGAAGGGNANNSNNADGDTGGTTGALTTTPEAKTDDALGTRGTSEPTVATPGGAETGDDDHGCAATQMWDATTMKCVPR